MLDAHGQSIRRNIIAWGDCLILNGLAGERKVHLVPAISLLQFVCGLGEPGQGQNTQQHQSSCHFLFLFVYQSLAESNIYKIHTKLYIFIYGPQSMPYILCAVQQKKHTSTVFVRQAAWQIAGRWLLPLERPASGYIESPTFRRNRSSAENRAC